MKTASITIDGEAQLILTPESEVEKLWLAGLFKTEVEGHIHETLQIGDKKLVDSVVITSKSKVQ